MKIFCLVRPNSSPALSIIINRDYSRITWRTVLGLQKLDTRISLISEKPIPKISSSWEAHKILCLNKRKL